MKSKFRFGVMLLLLLSSAACVKVDTSSKTPTIGSEIIDLSRARELGKLSDREYQELRRKVLASF